MAQTQHSRVIGLLLWGKQVMANRATNLLTCIPGDGTRNKDASRSDFCTVINYSVCGALSLDELVRFGASSKTIYLPEGRVLVRDGDVEDFIFSVTNGCLKSFKQLPDGRRQVTGFYFPCDFIGLADSDVYLADIEAVSDAGLCCMERKSLNALSRDIPNLERRLHELAPKALAELQGQIVLLGRKTAQERVATFLRMLLKRSFERGVTANPVSIPMICEDIADFLGLTKETFSRTFSTLRKLKLIGPDVDKTVELLDRDGLQRVAEGF